REHRDARRDREQRAGDGEQPEGEHERPAAPEGVDDPAAERAHRELGDAHRPQREADAARVVALIVQVEREQRERAEMDRGPQGEPGEQRHHVAREPGRRPDGRGPLIRDLLHGPTLRPPQGRGRYEIRTAAAPGPRYGRGMKSYGQFCAIARALELLGERWTLLVVRELLCGSRRFGEIRRGIPRISRTMLSVRLRALAEAGVVEVRDGAAGPEYGLTAAGHELAAVIRELGTWGQRWLPRE